MTTDALVQIQHVASLYGHVVDHRLWERLDEVYEPDGVYDRGAVGGDVHEGREAVRSYFAASSGMPLAHHVTNVVVDRIEGGVAHGRAKYFTVGTDLSVGSGEYEDVWALGSDGWRLRRRVARPLTPVHDDEVRAIEEIKRLKARYCRLYDSGRWDEFRRLFTDDLVSELEGSGRFGGADAFLAGILERRGAATVRSVHHCLMPEIEVHGDTANGIWAMNDYVDRLETDEVTRTVSHGYGHYHEGYRLVAGGWRIATLRLTRIRVDHLPEGTWPPFPDDSAWS